MPGESVVMKGLTKTQKEFLKILESFMHEERYQFPEGFFQMEELYHMAAEHHMTAAVYEQIQREDLIWKEHQKEIVGAFKNVTIHQVVMQAQRTDGFLRIYNKICNRGIRPLVVKGIICRNLYAKPDYRISGDEDMLLKKEEFLVCDEILKEEGFQREELDMNNLPYEIPYMHPKNGVYIELHFSLFPEESGAYGHLNQEFDAAFDTCIGEDIQGVTIWTLEPTFHLLYLICHSLKHFLHSGFGIRQVCDMVMMAEHYGDRINWKYIEERLKALQIEEFWNGLVDIGRKYLGFSIEEANYPEHLLDYKTDCGNLLMDLLDSGVYGDSSMERKHSSNVTLAAAESGKKDTAASLKASLFPGISYMKKGFPWLEKYPWLLLAAWIIRIVRYMKSSSREKGKESNSMEIGMTRVELLKEYHIID